MGRNKQNKEDLILAESARLFRQKGFNATTMDEIAAAVGLSKASVFHYFDTKEAILYKLTKPALEIGVNSMREIVESDLTPEEKVRKALWNHLGQIDHYSPRLFTLSGQDLNCVSDKMRKEMAPLMAKYERLWREIITEGVNAGQFRPDLNIKLITYAILGMCNYMLDWYKKGGALSAAQVTDQYIELISEGLFVNSVSDVSCRQLCEVSGPESSANP